MKILLCSLLGFALMSSQDKAALVDAPMPDPTQTFNLQFRLLKAGKVDAAIALALDDAVTEEARTIYKDITEMTKSRGFSLLGFEKIIRGDLAVVLLLDATPKKRSIDVDPCYLVAREGT